ncbi:MAG: isoprenylcysteine carboxylmethyltransferase family protein [Rhizobiaceae bacterium]|nr:isoprenylcysteine carboxylmethyltransferase family protein [Rhizobiaceae bacterium]
MTRSAALLFAVTGFALVHLVFAYLIFWLANLLPGHSIDSPTGASLPWAFVIDLLLVALFGLQHSGMARRRFKAVTARWVAPGLERAVYVWFAVAALFSVVHFSQPLPVMVWSVDQPLLRGLIWLLFACGWAIAAAAYWSVGILYLLGVEQALALYRGRPQPAQPFVDSWAYRYVRNPQQLGLLVAFWSTPDMTLGHLVFAAAMTAYIVVGMSYEKRDLVALHGQSYADYAKGVPAVIPWRLRRGG